MEIGVFIVLSLGGAVFSARLGLGLRLQGSPLWLSFPLVFTLYALTGFCLGQLSDSRAPQGWLSWILEGDRVLLFQAGEIILGFVMIRMALHLPSLASAGKGHRGPAAMWWWLLLAPSPFLCIWGIFAVGMIQQSRAGWAGDLIGMSVFGAFLILAFFVCLISKRSGFPVSLAVSIFVILHLLVAAFAVFLPAAINLPGLEDLTFSFPAARTVLMMGLMILIAGLGFISPWRRLTAQVLFPSRPKPERREGAK